MSSPHHYEINDKVPFGQRTKSFYQADDLSQTFSFSWQMTFAHSGEHRSHRSGGQHFRNNLQKFCDIFLGKMGEVAFFNLCKTREKTTKISEIDYACYALGQWDSADFIVNDQYHIAIKTTKHFGNLLLLEEKDWAIEQGHAIYLPNKQATSQGIYDFLFLSRVKTNLYDLIQTHQVAKREHLTEIEHDLFHTIFKLLHVELEVVGYVSNQDLQAMIREQYLLPQNAMLNRNTRMDAANFYLQSGFFKPF